MEPEGGVGPMDLSVLIKLSAPLACTGGAWVDPVEEFKMVSKRALVPGVIPSMAKTDSMPGGTAETGCTASGGGGGGGRCTCGAGAGWGAGAAEVDVAERELTRVI